MRECTAQPVAVPQSAASFPLPSAYTLNYRSGQKEARWTFDLLWHSEMKVIFRRLVGYARKPIAEPYSKNIVWTALSSNSSWSQISGPRELHIVSTSFISISQVLARNMSAATDRYLGAWAGGCVASLARRISRLIRQVIDVNFINLLRRGASQLAEMASSRGSMGTELQEGGQMRSITT